MAHGQRGPLEHLPAHNSQGAEIMIHSLLESQEAYPMRRGSPANNRLKQTARGRSGAESLRRTRAAAYPERWTDAHEPAKQATPLQRHALPRRRAASSVPGWLGNWLSAAARLYPARFRALGASRRKHILGRTIRQAARRRN